MVFVYICEACKQGDHEHCEQRKDLPPKDSEIVGGGHCICPHTRVYESPDDVWKERNER